MSLVDPEKLITLISDLNELLSSWNVNASDAYRHTQQLKNEGVEVHNLAEKDKSRAIDTEDSDHKSIDKSKSESIGLFEKSEELHKQTEPLPQEAHNRLTRAQNNFKRSQQNQQKSNEWMKIATSEFKRAKGEYDKALDDYNRQVPIRNQALSVLKSTPEYITTTWRDKDGHSDSSTRRNPAYDRAKANFDREEAELERRQKILDEKERIIRLANQQLAASQEASQLSSQMFQNSQHLLERSKDLKEWSDNAYRSASYALSAAKSALNFDTEAEKQNGFQRETNDETLRLFEKIKSSVDEIVISVQKIIELTDSCNALNVQYSTSLDGKSALLHKLSAVLPDEIRSFKVD